MMYISKYCPLELDTLSRAFKLATLKIGKSQKDRSMGRVCVLCVKKRLGFDPLVIQSSSTTRSNK